MAEIRRLKITGGPKPHDVRIVDSATGADLTSAFTGFTIQADPNHLVQVHLTAFAELDIMAEQLNVAMVTS